MKNKKSLIFIIIAVVIIAIVGVVIFTLTQKDNENDGANKDSKLASLNNLLEEYNAKNEGTETDISLMESDTELAFMINGLVDAGNNHKQNIFVNYTTMTINSIVYDKELQPAQVINMFINDEYVVKKVLVYDYAQDKLFTYENNDPKIEEYQQRAGIMSDKIKEVFNEESLNGISLFNKTMEDVK